MELTMVKWKWEKEPIDDIRHGIMRTSLQDEKQLFLEEICIGYSKNPVKKGLYKADISKRQAESLKPMVSAF